MGQRLRRHSEGLLWHTLKSFDPQILNEGSQNPTAQVAPGGAGELARRMNKAAKTLSAPEMRAARWGNNLG